MPAQESNTLIWTWDQDKQFERALVTYPDNFPNRWEKIASEIAGKSIEDVKYHYQILVEDVNRIESGLVQLPCYSSGSDGSTNLDGKKNGNNTGSETNHGGKCSKVDQERRKGIAWTEDEHRLFLLGLEKYGKGDWRSISRNFVVTRTPTQVASHAQKYFIRLNSMNKDRRRSSIHDITNANNSDVVVPQAPITGQPNCKPKHPQPPTIAGPVYGAPTIGQPIGVSAVGTPVNLPSPAHLAYGVVPGAPMTYPVPHTPAQR